MALCEKWSFIGREKFKLKFLKKNNYFYGVGCFGLELNILQLYTTFAYVQTSCPNLHVLSHYINLHLNKLRKHYFISYGSLILKSSGFFGSNFNKFGSKSHAYFLEIIPER